MGNSRGDAESTKHNKVSRAVSSGQLPVGNLEIPCYVLEDETRLITQRGMQTTVKMSTSGGTGGAHRTANFVERLENKLSLSNDLSVRMRSPIVFLPPTGGMVAYGYEATALIDFCELLLKYRDSGEKLTKEQGKYVGQADIVVRAFAKVGIIAVIDEVTGHQYKRPHDELTKLLALYVRPEHRPWVREVPRDFTRELYRVYGWDTGSQRGPRYAGKLTRKLIYEQLPPPVLPRLDELNPSNENYQRKRKFFQHLTPEVGLQHFRTQLAGVMALLRASPNKRIFLSLFNRAYGSQGTLFTDQELEGDDN
jgi:hypothetical protein